MNEFQIPCIECANQLNIYGNNNEIICNSCNKTYPIEESIKYGMGGSPSNQTLSYEGSTIIIYYLENIPFDLLEKAFNQHKLISNSEIKPSKLFDTFKDYHDSIFKRLQDVLGSERSELNEAIKNQINYNPIGQGFNLKNIMEQITTAFPSESENTDLFLNQNKELVNSMYWLRNKIEHIAIRKWPIPSYIHIDKKKNPEDLSTTIFNYNYLNKVNNFVIDLYLKIVKIDNRNTSEYEYENIERFRV